MVTDGAATVLTKPLPALRGSDPSIRIARTQVTSAPKPNADWESVEREYRAGVLSVREIGKAAGLSHVAVLKKAKREGWTQNLAARVKEAVTTKLVTADVTIGNQREIIEAVALRSVDVILAHRKDIAKLRTMATGMTAELEADAEKPAKERMSLKERASIIESLSRTTARAVVLERQAFGLDDDTKAPDSVEAADASSPRGEIERRLARLAAAV